MKALGMIEVYGYLAAVEALDCALKAANVKMVDVTLVQGGLVAVFITGDVGAVKAAMDASKIAAERVGKVISVHVIPRPSEKIEMIVPYHSSEITPSQKAPASNTYTATAIDKTEAIVYPSVDEPQTESNAKLKEPHTKSGVSNVKLRETSDWYTEEELYKMKVDQLRSLARELGITNMTKKEIRFATKHEIIDAISKFIEQER